MRFFSVAWTRFIGSGASSFADRKKRGKRSRDEFSFKGSVQLATFLRRGEDYKNCNIQFIYFYVRSHCIPLRRFLSVVVANFKSLT